MYLFSYFFLFFFLQSYTSQYVNSEQFSALPVETVGCVLAEMAYFALYSAKANKTKTINCFILTNLRLNLCARLINR